MRRTTERQRRLAAACALISVLALGGVYGGQAMAGSSSPSSGASSSPSSESSDASATPSPGTSSSSEPSKGSDPPKDDDSTDWKRQDDASRAYGECMRDNGLEDFPDIVFYTADGGSEVRVRIEGMDFGDHSRPDRGDFREAAEACEHILEDIGVEGPVSPWGLAGEGDGPWSGCGEHWPGGRWSDGEDEDHFDKSNLHKSNHANLVVDG